MAKVTVYECDGMTPNGGECEAYEECDPGKFPAGWLTITLEARIHSGHRAPGGRGRDRKYEERPDGSDWLHLCPDCQQVTGSDLRLAGVVAAARSRRLAHGGEGE